jgi:putative membrane protein
MTILVSILIGFVALLHVGFLILEMFLWTKPFGRKTFRMTEEYAQASASLAANQGLYNGFLAAGLIWGLVVNDFAIKAFFLICVLVAGLYGGLTTKRTILYIQALPGLLALIALYLSK